VGIERAGGIVENTIEKIGTCVKREEITTGRKGEDRVEESCLQTENSTTSGVLDFTSWTYNSLFWFE